MSAAERQRAYRQRRASGRLTVRLELDEVAAAELLIDAGYLAQRDADDRDAIAHAVQRLWNHLVIVDLEAGDA